MILRQAAVFLLTLSSLIGAQTTERVHFVRASGEAKIAAKPDRAQILIGVVTRAASAAEASSHNAEQSTSVLKAMQGVLGAGGQVKTSGYSISPQYDYSNNHAPRLTGYEASNSVQVTVDDLPLLGKVIDAATANGANNIAGISFLLRDDSAVRAEALAAAAVKARSNAEAIAKALNLHVGAVLQAEPSELPSVRPVPMMRAMAAQAQAVPTPVEAGDLDISATVTVTVEVN